jgi:hypothetical protein
MRGGDFQGESYGIIQIISFYVIGIAKSNMAILNATDYPWIRGRC